jgi:hypothetical protein
VVTLAIVDAHSECGVRGIDESRNRSSVDDIDYYEVVIIIVSESVKLNETSSCLCGLW